jgi:hypothetical protein
LVSTVSLISVFTTASRSTVEILPTNVIASCHCCHEEQSHNNESNESPRPQSPDDCSECPNCFCAGSWVLVKDLASAIEFTLATNSVAFLAKPSFVPPSLDSYESTESFGPLYGRNLLRRYCVYLL